MAYGNQSLTESELDDLGFSKLQHELCPNLQCGYFEIDEFKNKIKGKKDIFSTLSLNIRSISNKINELQDLIHEISNDTFSFSAICLQELWCITENQKIELEGYNFESLLRKVRRGGGVGILLRSDLHYEVIHNISTIQDGYESLFIKVFLTKDKYKLIGSIYRPPNSNLIEFNKWINDLLNTFDSQPELKKSDEIILCGDFNINLLNCENHVQTNEFLNSLISSSFLPAISLPSRINEISGTLIDNIFSNRLRTGQEGGLILSSISDHLPVFSLNVKHSSKTDSKTEYFRNFSKTNIGLFKERLTNQDWSSITQDPNPSNAFDKFSETLKLNFEEIFPLQKKRPNKRKVPINPWMSKELLELRKKKQKLFKDKLRLKTDEANIRFKSCNNQYKHKIRKEKKNYYDKKFSEYSKDIKKTWGLINALIKKNRCKHNVPNLFTDENREYRNFSEISEGFNDFFL